MLGTDCLSGVCTNAVCQAPTCLDTVRNGDETGVDCGGSCTGCDTGGGCNAGADCLSGVCLNGACQAAACDDQVRNGDETDVDCGGSCGGCDDGLLCAVDADCSGGRCENNRCASGPNYARFGRWTTVPDGNLGGANVPLQWPDGIARSGITARGAALTAVCARPSDVWGANNPVRGQVYRMRGGGPGYGLRYDGPCAGDPAPRRIQNLGRACDGRNAYLRVMHTASYPLPHNARFTHNGLCIRSGVLGELRHPPTARGHRRP